MMRVRRLNFVILVVAAAFAVGCGYSKQKFSNTSSESAFNAVKTLCDQNELTVHVETFPKLLVAYDKQGYKHIFRFHKAGDSTGVELKIHPGNEDLKKQRFRQLGEILKRG